MSDDYPRRETHPNRQVSRSRYSGPEFDALARSMAHYPFVGPSDPKWNKVKPNFEGIPGGRGDPHDAARDDRLTRERGG